MSNKSILDKMKMDIDSESVSIYIDFGEDKDIMPICYWHEDEWLEDAETVVPAMLKAIDLFNHDKK